ncbi:MAG: HD domain-containing protein [Planctomycetota bacterium]|jgi:predicted metal-dependent HD superfamily phosphohydrolase
MNTDLLIELTRRYSEPHRRYHDLRHIANMLRLGAPLGLSNDQVMAIWFHDAVYDPRSKTNERDSAALAVELLTKAGWTESSIKTIERIVLDTEIHKPTIPESEQVLDLDLATLGGTWEQYHEIGQRVREEYMHVPEAEWAEGRGKWLEKILSSDQIYRTEWGKPREADARRNLSKDLELLRGGQQ